jgi:hypothetical protein
VVALEVSGFAPVATVHIETVEQVRKREAAERAAAAAEAEVERRAALSPEDREAEDREREREAAEAEVEARIRAAAKVVARQIQAVEKVEKTREKYPNDGTAEKAAYREAGMRERGTTAGRTRK